MLRKADFKVVGEHLSTSYDAEQPFKAARVGEDTETDAADRSVEGIGLYERAIRFDVNFLYAQEKDGSRR